MRFKTSWRDVKKNLIARMSKSKVSTKVAFNDKEIRH